jgi:hypothetical protein
VGSLEELAEHSAEGFPNLAKARSETTRRLAEMREHVAGIEFDRIAWAFLELGAVDAGVRAMGAYDRFLGILDDSDARKELEHMPRDQASKSAVFQTGKRLGADFEQGLLALLFETRLEPMVREYGIF